MASDFDEYNIKDSLADLDEEMNRVEDQRPEDEGDRYDEEIWELMTANANLRRKVHEISEMVAHAIVNAKQI